MTKAANLAASANATAGNVTATAIQSNAASTPTLFKDSAGTEVGTLCRAWVSFNGTNGSIRASFNVSSVTRTGTGKYTVTYGNALPDANYSFQMHCIDTAGGDRTVIAGGSADQISPSTTAINFNTFQSLSSTMADPAWVAVAIFR